MLCLKERSLQKRNTQNSKFKEENSSRFYSWGLQQAVVKKSLFDSVFPPSSSWGDGSVVIAVLLILLCQSYCWQAGRGMGQGVLDLCWTCLETCLVLPKSRYLISYIEIWWINSKVPEGSVITSENNSLAYESSCVIILKSRLNSTGHSARMR